MTPTHTRCTHRQHRSSATLGGGRAHTMPHHTMRVVRSTSHTVSTHGTTSCSVQCRCVHTSFNTHTQLVLHILVVTPESSGGNPHSWHNKQHDLFNGHFTTPTHTKQLAECGHGPCDVMLVTTRHQATCNNIATSLQRGRQRTSNLNIKA